MNAIVFNYVGRRLSHCLKLIRFDPRHIFVRRKYKLDQIDQNLWCNAIRKVELYSLNMCVYFGIDNF